TGERGDPGARVQADRCGRTDAMSTGPAVVATASVRMVSVISASASATASGDDMPVQGLTLDDSRTRPSSCRAKGEQPRRKSMCRFGISKRSPKGPQPTTGDTP